MNKTSAITGYYYGYNVTLNSMEGQNAYYCTHTHILNFLYKVILPSNALDIPEDLIVELWYLSGDRPSFCFLNTTEVDPMTNAYSYDPNVPDQYGVAG